MPNRSAVLTVSQLNRQIRSFLENEVSTVHVEGEISNLTKPASGHYYFTLKDATAQLRAVYFKNYHLLSTVKLQNGQKIIAQGKLSLYEARGDYQLIIERIEAAGLGALYLQFEALKLKLQAKGYFNLEHKKSIPTFPNCIGIITSPTGAAIRDILTTLQARFPLAPVIIYASEVQGTKAASFLIDAISTANKDKHCDILILARGGGSIEDLWPFNEETLAEAIYQSHIPIVSGVGHETDFTIADFVADFRAATPTAAAIAITPNQEDLKITIQQWDRRLRYMMQQKETHLSLRLEQSVSKLRHIRYALIQQQQRIDGLVQQLQSSLITRLQRHKHRLENLIHQLHLNHPRHQVNKATIHLRELHNAMIKNMQINYSANRERFLFLIGKLEMLSPLATLHRGYAIALMHNQVLINSNQVKVNDEILVKLHQGQIRCQVIDNQSQPMINSSC